MTLKLYKVSNLKKMYRKIIETSSSSSDGVKNYQIVKPLGKECIPLVSFQDTEIQLTFEKKELREFLKKSKRSFFSCFFGSNNDDERDARQSFLVVRLDGMDRDHTQDFCMKTYDDMFGSSWPVKTHFTIDFKNLKPDTIYRVRYGYIQHAEPWNHVLWYDILHQKIKTHPRVL